VSNLTNDYLIIIQARMGSSRLPKKMLERIGSDTLFAIVVKRLASAFPEDKIVLATSDHIEDRKLVDAANKLGIQSFRGSENNVFSRFYDIARKKKSKYIVRITGDSPLVDPKLIELGLEQISKWGLDYVSTTIGRFYPIGVHVEIFRSKLIIDAKPSELTVNTREHVTPFIYNDDTRSKGLIASDIKYPDGRYTVDYSCDLQFMRSLVDAAGIAMVDFTVETLRLIEQKFPQIFEINEGIIKERVVPND
jgi:spore coat polysaccharide biosynthesis protein SpsF (cytidylyltransferase family)